MTSTKRWIKIIVGSLLIGTLLGGGITAARVFFGQGAEQLLKKGEIAYSKGMEAMTAGDDAAAAARFEEANLQASKAIDAVDKEQQKAQSKEGKVPAELLTLQGQALWLKARTVRDHYFARARAEGKPLPDTTDPLSGEKFRCVLFIPDEQARREAFICLRQASLRLPENAGLLHETLFTEMMLPALDWASIEKVSRQTLQLNPKDPWALYLLARFEYEQPATAPNGATPVPPAKAGKRSRERVLQARQHVKQLKATTNYLLWRTSFLEAQITQWLRDDAAKANGNRRETEDAALRSLLFGPKGAMARASAGEALEHPSKWDAEGVLGLHEMALNLAVEDSRQPGATTEKVVELLTATLSLCRQLADKDAARVADCALAAIQALSKAELVLASEPPPDWNKDLNLAQELVRKAREQNAARPGLYEAIAGLLAREAHLEGKRGNKERRAELNQQALQWVEEGLRQGKEAKWPAEQLVPLNMLAAEMKTVAGGKTDNVAGHLNALKEVKTPRARTLVALLEASAAERDGRLGQARKLLEQVVASQESELAIRAHMVLGGVYLALGQPDKALASLQQVAQAYKVFDRLSTQEKSWAMEFIRGPEDLALLMISAHVDSALKQLRLSAQRNPGKPVSLDLVRHRENAIAELRKQFQKETPQDRQARQILVRFYTATQRRDLAERELAELRTYYPNSADVLRTEVDLILSARDASGKPRERTEAIKEADARIAQFLKDHPADLDARFFRVEWLIRTQRAEEALSYLRSPTSFSDTKSERYQRVLAAALLTRGDREGSQKVLEHLPHNPDTDALLVQAASAQNREKLVQQALARYEGNALFQNWKAMFAYNKGDYEAAAEAFLRASQYNRYAETSKRGLLQSLLTLAQTDPARARNLAVRMHKTSTDEPLLLLASAYAALQLDEIGTPSENPDPAQSMASALNAWEQLVLEQHSQEKASVPLTKASFWALAGRQDLALAESVRGLNMDPKNPAALRQAIQLALELRDPDHLAATRKRLHVLRQIQPDNADVQFLEARFDEWNEQPKEASAIYEALLKKDPKLTEAYARLTALLSKQGDREREQEVVKRWRKEQPDDVAAAQAEVRLLAERKEAAQSRKLAETFLDEQLRRERDRLESEKSAADTDTGDVEKTRQLRLDQSRSQLQTQMIIALIRGKAWSEAEAWLQQLLAKSSNQQPWLILLGDLYVSQEAWDKARAVYEKVLAKDKTHGAAANNMAWMLARHLNNAPAALRIVQELRKGRFSHKPISGDRLRPEFLDTLGVIYTKMNRGALFNEMRDVFEAARQRFPHDPRMYMYLGHAYAGMLETDRAENLYTSAVEIARKSGRKYLSPRKCQEVIVEVEAAQKKIRETAQLP